MVLQCVHLLEAQPRKVAKKQPQHILHNVKHNCEICNMQQVFFVHLHFAWNWHCEVTSGKAHLGKGECRWCRWARLWAVHCFEGGGHWSRWPRWGQRCWAPQWQRCLEGCWCLQKHSTRQSSRRKRQDCAFLQKLEMESSEQFILELSSGVTGPGEHKCTPHFDPAWSILAFKVGPILSQPKVRLGEHTEVGREYATVATALIHHFNNS